MKRFLSWMGVWLGLLVGMVIAEMISAAQGDTADRVAMVLFFLAVFAFFWPLLKWFVKVLFNPLFWVFVLIFRRK